MFIHVKNIKLEAKFNKKIENLQATSDLKYFVNTTYNFKDRKLYK